MRRLTLLLETQLAPVVKRLPPARILASALSLTVALGAASVTHADTLLIPLGEQAPEKQTTQRPAKGLSTAEVVEIFGKPLKQTPAVGNPPISRWTFDDFVVYFESDKVIHTVLKHRKTQRTITIPAEVPSPGPALAPAEAPAGQRPSSATPYTPYQ